jgi:hypothetical protein
VILMGRRGVAALRTLYWLAVLCRIEVGLRRSSLPSLCRRLGVHVDLVSPTTPSRSVWPVPRIYERHVRALMRATSWWPFGDTCLRRCLLLGMLLRTERPALRIGIRRDEAGTFGAHSWLEIAGRSLDPASADFAVLHGPGAA